MLQTSVFLLVYTILFSCLSSFFLLLAIKLKIIEKIQIRGNSFFSDMASCFFCLSFWITLVISIITFIITKEVLVLFIPLFATPIVRKLL